MAKYYWFARMYRRRLKEFGPIPTAVMQVRLENIVESFRMVQPVASVVELRRIERAIALIEETMESAHQRAKHRD